MDISLVIIILGKNLKLNKTGALPQTPRFNAFRLPKKEAKKKKQYASFSYNHCLNALVAPQRCHIPLNNNLSITIIYKIAIGHFNLKMILYNILLGHFNLKIQL